jgi:hypothetical protein
MPPTKKITVTITNETAAILAYLKETKHLKEDRAVELALKKYFDAL